MEQVLKYFKSFTATLIQFLSNLREEPKLTKEKRKESLSGSVLTKKKQRSVFGCFIVNIPPLGHLGHCLAKVRFEFGGHEPDKDCKEKLLEENVGNQSFKIRSRV